jgi:hypothetical protein
MIAYSFSELIKQKRRIEVFSYFVANGQFFSYVVQLNIWDKTCNFRKRIQKSFCSIEKAEAFHQDVVLKCAERYGYEIKVTTVK